MSVKHTAMLSGMVLLTGLLVWIIQLARGGDPIGYIILTGIGVLLALPITGGVLALLISALGKLQPQAQPLSREDLKTIREAHNVLRVQNQYLTRLVNQAGQQPALLAGPNGLASETEPLLTPGQMRTADGFIIDGVAFDHLDDANVSTTEEL
jgi:hypothetical protein